MGFAQVIGRQQFQEYLDGPPHAAAIAPRQRVDEHAVFDRLKTSRDELAAAAIDLFVGVARINFLSRKFDGADAADSRRRQMIQMAHGGNHPQQFGLRAFEELLIGGCDC